MAGGAEVWLADDAELLTGTDTTERLGRGLELWLAAPVPDADELGLWLGEPPV